MEKLAIGLWGCYFGMVVWILFGSVLAYTRSMHRIALNAAIAALASAFFVLALLGGLPISNADTLARFLAQLAGLVAVLLPYFLLVGLGVMEISDPDVRGAGAIAMVRGMSRTAMSFESRIAWFDHGSGKIIALPTLSHV